MAKLQVFQREVFAPGERAGAIMLLSNYIVASSRMRLRVINLHSNHIVNQVPWRRPSGSAASLSNGVNSCTSSWSPSRPSYYHIWTHNPSILLPPIGHHRAQHGRHGHDPPQPTPQSGHFPGGAHPLASRPYMVIIDLTSCLLPIGGHQPRLHIHLPRRNAPQAVCDRVRSH
jgi:hypothetical protein